MQQLMIATLGLVLMLQSAVAQEPKFPDLPESPSKLLDTLRTSGDRHVVQGFRLQFVKESDLPQLIGLLDSKEPCAFLDLAVSSIYYPGRSTVGHEAAYLVEGFWKGYYPTDLTSQRFKPNMEAIKAWHRSWSHLKRMSAQKASESPEHASFEIIAESEQIVFDAAAEVSAQLLVRNLDERSLAAPELFWGLTIVWDGIEYRRDPKYIGNWNGAAEILPQTSWRTSVSISEYQIPPDALTAGRHTMALKGAAATSNTLSYFIK